MSKTLTRKDYVFIGSMLFGIMFGAGNLIFPVHLGQEAGAHVWPAVFGFLMSAIGLPFLGIVGMAFTRSTSVYDLASRAGHHFGTFFTVLLYLVIGPFFAIPRLASTSFQIGLGPFVGEDNALALALYSLFFFTLAWAMSRQATKILDYVGKFLNPVFLVVLGILLVLVLFNPMGGVSSAPIQASYQSNALATGVLEGYNTLDVLASLAFAILVISALKNLGIKEPRQMATDMVKSGVISMSLMAILYTLLAYAGATSLSQFNLSENGGIALAQIAHYYLGTFGSVLLALIVFFGCLKTAVGLLTAFSETFAEMFPSVSYHTFLAGATLFPAIFANVGLTNIIAYSIPVLMFIYPLAIVLVGLALLERWLKGNRTVYRWTIYLTLLPAMIDGLASSPWATVPVVSALVDLSKKLLPFSTIGMSWVLPASLGLVIGVFIAGFKGEFTERT
ncbi:branched-chain amino acid transport system II carrier protein [Streptococcus moroccensis]|uniref:Branched-chain amino acid transport system carrier protein n=1 Tax=Streptococcus moroccensis TaxID=1451356 RepID=A0ABT9YRP9_9STRE|nr:branched-chain amino acid transport system II carrier protein [Streptococcus moroccensis]MDQ0222676.1 LIVCS family branched-chain amino acid:cation transporter [Streptococcus moroccensis]